MNPGGTCRPATASGTGTVTGRVSLNLMCPVAQAMGQAGQVEALPAGTVVVLRVSGAPDPAVIDRLRVFGAHLNYDVHGRDGYSTGEWVRALRDGRYFG